ncbi:helix-turn-helix domain-containing protein [Flavobacterium sp.]|uniref:helix-turn-helix domain-containing protein n=1 Tax=Flavobacterium sp. TaxID=239 RepID=UPI003D6A854B
MLHKDLEIEVLIYEKFPSKLALEQHFTGSRVILLLVRSGLINLKGNQVHYSLGQNELLVIPIATACEILSMSNALQVTLLTFTQSFIFKNSIRKPNIGFFEFFVTKLPSKVSLQDDDTALLEDLFSILANTNYKIEKYPFYKEVVILGFNILFYVVASLYNSSSWSLKERYSRKEKLVFRFLEILNLHCIEQHNVKFYSNTLLISEGHLSKVVKEITNKTIKEFIIEAITVEAKIMLQNSDLTILQIVEELHFSSSSSFSNFFKKSTSMSPSEYRLRLTL